MRTVLFICTGNTCRSPMAEAIAQRQIDRSAAGTGGDAILAVSAGVGTSGGSRTTREAVLALAGLGITYDGRSKPLTRAMIEAADVVLGMTAEHVATAQALVAGDAAQASKILLLDPAGDIEDPIGMDQAAYDELARHMQKIIPGRLEEVLSDEDRAGVGSSRDRPGHGAQGPS